MKKIKTTISFSIFIFFSLTGQGLKIDTIAYNRLPTTKVALKSNKPTSCSLREYAPLPGNQGDYFSCSAYSFINMVNISVSMENNWKRKEHFALINSNKLSPDFLYGSVLDDGDNPCDNEGVYMEKVFDYFNINGTVLDTSYLLERRKNNKNPCFFRTSDDSLNASALKRNIQYNKLFEFGKPSINKIEDLIFDKKPIVIGIYLFNEYSKKIVNKTARFTSEDGFDMAHAVTIIGYKRERDTLFFEIMDSQGSIIGDNGFWWIDEHTLLKRIAIAYDFKFNIQTKPKMLSTTIEIVSQELDKVSVPIEFDSAMNCYVTKIDDWEQIDQFKFQISNIRLGNYLYIFTFDNSKFDNNKFDVEIIDKSAFAKYQNASYIYPNDDSVAYDIPVKDDQIIFLYTYNSLTPNLIQSILDKLNECINTQFYDCLNSLSGLKICRETDYHLNQIGCTITKTEGNVIPLILLLKTNDDE